MLLITKLLTTSLTVLLLSAAANAAVKPTHITLSTSGVMLVEATTSEQSEMLLLPRRAIDDVLKSFMSSDAALISLPAPNQQNFSFRNSTGILQQLIGEQVTVKDTVATILSAEQTGEDGTVFVTLLSGEKIQRLPLTSIQFNNLAVVKKLSENAAVAAEQDTDTLPVTLSFNSKRNKINWLQPSPTWHMTYKIKLAGSRATVSGWAVFENNTRQNWENISLTLASGDLKALQKQLYQPHTIHRPEVNLADKPVSYRESANFSSDVMVESRSVGAAQLSAPVNFNSQQNAASVSFTINKPVSIDSGRTISLPVLDFTTAADLVATYNHQQHQAHPALQLSFTNESSAGLPAGIATTFEHQKTLTYLGDDTLKPTAANARATLDVANDTRLNIAHTQQQQQYLVGISATEHVIALDILNEIQHKHTIKSDHSTTKKLHLQFAKSAYKPKEKSIVEKQRYWQQQVLVSGQKTTHLTTPFIRKTTETFSLYDNNALKNWHNRLANLHLTQDIRAEVQPFQKILRALNLINQKITYQQQLASAAEKEQARLRENMQVLDKKDTLYQTYKNELIQQDKRIKASKSTINKLEAERRQLQTKLATTVKKL